MAKTKTRLAREQRHRRVRKKVFGTPERPRLCVYRSLSHIYAQVIDDTSGTTLVSASTIDRAARSLVAGKTKTEQARIVGKLVAERALEAGITKVVFDRGGFKYHGRIKSLADASREAGLNF
ncbi:MAG: 50S ribosomal protein L18 [Caldilineae bacterium]|nr:MAG: 50S ribosomal protein L18 [Caldilineae bacterium]